MPDTAVLFDPVPAARALAPEIAARAAEIEAERRLPADLAAQLARAGLFRMLVPKRYGGGEVSPLTLWQTIETLAAADAAVAWCVMIASTTGVTAAYLPPDQAKEVFGDPLTITGGVFAPLGQAHIEGDTAIVGGRWAWASGSANCHWLMGGCVLMENGAPRKLDDGTPETRMFIAPRAEVELIDTWFASGLRGTGSGDMVMAKVRIPLARSVSLSRDAPLVQAPVYAFPVFGLLALGIAAVACGNARAALDEFSALAVAKKPQGAGRSLAQRSAVQAQWAEAETALRSARAFVMEVIDTAMAAAVKGEGLSLRHRADLRLACAHMAKTGADVCRAVYTLGGGSSVYESSTLQRRFRDAHVATQHIMVAPTILEVAGRALLTGEGDWSVL
jgi:alkylation response protein AidB-like acyl-CoA dehydrogenase